VTIDKELQVCEADKVTLVLHEQQQQRISHPGFFRLQG
jgi:hypothetical protein